MTTLRLIVGALVAAAAASGGSAWAQSASLLNRPAALGAPVPFTKDVSLIELPEPKRFKKHDLINIVVDEQTLHQSNARANRRRDSSFEYNFDDFVVLLAGLRLRADQAVRNQTPAIDISALNNIRNSMQFNRVDRLNYSIQAEVAEVKPNGNLVIEAHGKVAVNNEVASYHLSGVVAQIDVDPLTRTISSSRIANKQILLEQVGPIRDSIKRGILTRMLDIFQIF